ncbi:Vegetative incompatibility protein HET-E-1 [Trametes pubescens]|uniref:Vegetative incompatibility protein HET-E-1 n=1 Tax=Trametes pubescens TaxID=154538 RepID=A0A1M2V2H9_TRAPU|nr:Vegetative incompatibility protein HET-E-1 [Trametes pubescens]
MWLLNTKTAVLQQFPSSKDVRYAIVSHVWQQEPKEQTFHEVRLILAQCKESGADPMSLLSRKIQGCCTMAAQAGYEWLWLDAVCIDHNSSAELSEAINSMFTWYADAQVCYAYLHDVGDDEDPSAESSAFRRSVWHTRGWTLQELLAPACVIFLSKTWHTLGSKHSLVVALSEVSRIKRDVLTRSRLDWLEGVSVAERMSWAAHRRTTRVEDRAYSLMGIFGINMPTIYGEGPRAFMRLQEEILQRIPDQSIFAWGRIHPDLEDAVRGLQVTHVAPGTVDDSVQETQTRLEDLLAPSPAEFAYSAGIKTLSMQDLATKFGVRGQVPQYTLTSYGMLVQLPLSQNLIGAEGVPAEASGAHASSPQYVVGAYIGDEVAGTDRQYYRAVLRPSFSAKVKSKKPQTQTTLPARSFTLTELYIRHAYATLALGQSRHPQRMREAEGGRALYTFHIPQWALNRLEAQHSLSVRPASFDGLVLQVSYDTRSGKLEHAVASMQFLDTARGEMVIVRIGVGCACFDSPLAGGEAIDQYWIDARCAPVAPPGYAQSYGEPLTLGAGAATPAECGLGRAHLRSASDAFVVAFDAPGRRLEIRIEQREGFEPAHSNVAGSYSISLDVQDATSDHAMSGADVIASPSDGHPGLSNPPVSSPPVPAAGAQPSELEVARGRNAEHPEAERNVGRAPRRIYLRRSAAVVDMLARLFGSRWREGQTEERGGDSNVPEELSATFV